MNKDKKGIIMQQRCARCNRKILLGAPSSSSATVNVEKEKECSFSFLPPVQLMDGGKQLRIAVVNMRTNAEIIRKQMLEYLQSWERYKDVSFVGYALTDGVFAAKLIVRLGVGTFLGSSVVDATDELTKKICTDIAGAFKEVVKRSCVDVIMRLHEIQEYTLNTNNELQILDAFIEMYNALNIDTYEGIDRYIPKVKLRKYISDKFLQITYDLADDYVKVLQVVVLGASKKQG